MSVYRPADAAEAVRIVASAAAEGTTLEIIGGGSKRALGRPVVADHGLDVSALSGIIDYDPPELVLTARAATPMDEIEAALADHGQMLAFEPPDWGGLLGAVGRSTLGGVIACNLAGPRRVRAGAARDHLLGFAAINGLGEAWKAGGRVVKNVTGYDMCKLQAGAFGTLSVLTELSVRVMPRPETSCTLLVPGLDDDAAIVAMARALNTQHEVSAAAHLPATVARRSLVAGVSAAVTALRLEGPAPSVAFRATALEALFGLCVRLEAPRSVAFWAEVGAVSGLLGRSGRHVWRLCPTPAAAALVVRALPGAEAFYDWGGGLVWVAADAEAAVVRSALRPYGGHATLISAPARVRETVEVFEPESATMAALSEKIKTSFDPSRILNPGRIKK